MSATRCRAPLLQLASVVASAGSAVLAKAILDSRPVAEFLLIFSASAVVVCLPWIDRASLRLFLSSSVGWCAVASNAVALTAFYFGLSGLSPGAHAFLSRTYVAFGFMLSYLLFREPFDVVRLALAAACVVSAVMIVMPEQTIVSQWLAAGATVLASGLYALNYALLRMAPPGVAPTTPVILYNLALIPFALSQFDLETSAPLRGGELMVAVGSSIFATLSLYWYFSTARHVTFFMSTGLRAASPFLVALIALPWFPMELTVVNLVGLVLMPCIIIAIGVVEYRRR